ncbi:MAG: DUF3325 domain-containing protein [Acidobacteriota bacterium]
MSGLPALLLTFFGVACLCGSMPRHQRDLFRRRLSDGASARLRAAGFSLLAVALALDLWLLSPAQGAIYWCGHLTVGAVATVALLKLREGA